MIMFNKVQRNTQKKLYCHKYATEYVLDTALFSDAQISLQLILGLYNLSGLIWY